ncbi:hypothetical protein EXN66_Car013303 [Channa argus]|uniref:Uncharacterized protein n=1 Tax=Channa argus TaxID=215402 RepID=A0A6G1Q5J1_CHAAH|nr:hypothetical protein EXN66_Car013303 [Channa argus]KAK2900126.1 hypothetical protein Q8A73_013255 [Channa argus]
MAAAAALSRSRGVAGVSTTKGLFVVFTLLCLFCLSSSRIYKKELHQLVETYHRAQQNVDRVKENHMLRMGAISDKIKNNMDSLASMKKHLSDSPRDFPPFEKYIGSIQDYMQETKDYMDGESEALFAEIKHHEEELLKIKKLIQALQEYEAEL